MAIWSAISSALFTLSSVDSIRYETFDCAVMNRLVPPGSAPPGPAEQIPQDSAVCPFREILVNAKKFRRLGDSSMRCLGSVRRDIGRRSGVSRSGACRLLGLRINLE